jgi:hypothetical protein
MNLPSLLPYYLKNFPDLVVTLDPEEGVYEPVVSPRRVYWVANLGRALVAGHSWVPKARVRSFLESAGFTEVLTTYDVGVIAPMVEELRQAYLDGKRDGVVGEDVVPVTR